MRSAIEWAALIQAVPDFPKPGILFRDITPLLADAGAFAEAIDQLAQPWRDAGIQAVCGIESRGFIFGAALAQRLGAGFVPLRKPGKLPPPRISVSYTLEYGCDRLEVRAGALRAGERVLIADDVLATGGTLVAAAELIRRFDAELLGASVLIELDGLRGRRRWPEDLALEALLHY